MLYVHFHVAHVHPIAPVILCALRCWAHTSVVRLHAAQWYAGDHFRTLAETISRHPGKLFLGTEATYELTRLGHDSDPSSAAYIDWLVNGVWSRGEGYAHAIIVSVI